MYIRLPVGILGEPEGEIGVEGKGVGVEGKGVGETSPSVGTGWVGTTVGVGVSAGEA